MSEIVSTIYTTPYYTFSSPRYNCLRNYETGLIPENYANFDALNGSCDKYFPCYTLTVNSIPKTELVNNNGERKTQQGSFAFREHMPRATTRIVGRKDRPATPFNATLQRYKLYQDKYITAKLNPGWCVIQTQIEPPASEGGKQTYLPQFVVRALGNNSSIKQLYAIDLDDEKTQQLYVSSTRFLAGEIVQFKKNLFKCIEETSSYPPTSGQDTDNWQYLNFERNVFNADIFALEETNSAFFMSITDDRRKFDPVVDNTNDDLICWSLAYYHAD